jgi:DNA-binding winged helix-turn-helix (wHTH) protein
MGVHVNSSVLEFGEFVLDVRNHRLLRSGSELKLERIPMELLILLATRPGELVRREEIVHELWGDEINVDTENAINTAVRKIRQVLGDDSSRPRFVQTISKRGYRFLAEPTQAALQPQPPALTAQPVRPKTIRWALLAGIAALLGAGLVIWIIRPSWKILRASKYVALTHDGLPKQGPLISDGVRIYFVSGNLNHRSISQMSVNGGEA